MSDCQHCPVEKSCDYEYKPCDCVHQRKFKQVELKPFQVGENDIVIAKDEAHALKVFNDEVGSDMFEPELADVTDLSDQLNISLVDEDGEHQCTLGSYIKNIKEPQYLLGWE